MTNLENLQSMVRYYEERIDCAQASGDAENVHRLEHKLEGFEHLVTLEKQRQKHDTPCGKECEHIIWS